MATHHHPGRTPAPLPVETVREAREHLSRYLEDARSLGTQAPPRFFGSHRKPEAVVLSYESYLQLLDGLENLEIAELVKGRDAVRTGTSLGLDEAMAKLGFDPQEHDLG